MRDGEIIISSVPLTLHAQVEAADAGELAIRATGTVDRYRHGITRMKGMAGRWLTLTISARAAQAK